MNRAKIFSKSFWITLGICLPLSPLILPFISFLLLADRLKGISLKQKTIFDFEYVKIKNNMDSNKILKSLGKQRGFYYSRWGGLALLTLIMALCFIGSGDEFIAMAIVSTLILGLWIFLLIRYLKKMISVLKKSQGKLTNEEFTLWVKILNKIEIKDPKAIENLNKKLEQIKLN